MPKIEINVPHDLEPNEAVARLQSFSSQVKHELGGHVSSIEEEWREADLDFVVRARGMSFDGNLAVTERTVEVVTKIPLAALPLRSMLESYMRKAIQNALESQSGGPG